MITFAPVRMNNPFHILWLMVTAKRPRRISEMKAVKESFWMRRGYTAMTFFGRILTHTQQEADELNATATLHSRLKRHETIHLRQAQSTHNSWLCFYILYIWYYMRALPQNRRRRNAAYYLNPFEMEAYEHDGDPEYLQECENGANGWRRYAKMSAKNRARITNS